MRKIIFLLVLSLAGSAYAQDYVVNPLATGTPTTINGKTIGLGGSAAVGPLGEQFIGVMANQAPFPVTSSVTTGANASFSMTTAATPQVISCAGAGNVKIQLTSSIGTGQIQAKGSTDSTNYPIAISLWQQNSTASGGYTPLTTYNVANGNGLFSVDCTAFTGIEIFVSTTGTNTVALTWAFNQVANHTIIDGFNPGTGNALLGKGANQTTGGAGDVIIADAAVQQSVLASSGTNGNYGYLKEDRNQALWTNDTLPLTNTHTQPSVTTATNFTCLASNTSRHGFILQNNSAQNIMINLNNGTLTGIVPSSSNLGIVLTPGSSYSTPPNATSVAAITCYQTSGGTINTISVTEY